MEGISTIVLNIVKVRIYDDVMRLGRRGDGKDRKYFPWKLGRFMLPISNGRQLIAADDSRGVDTEEEDDVAAVDKLGGVGRPENNQ